MEECEDLKNMQWNSAVRNRSTHAIVKIALNGKSRWSFASGVQRLTENDHLWLPSNGIQPHVWLLPRVWSAGRLLWSNIKKQDTSISLWAEPKGTLKPCITLLSRPINLYRHVIWTEVLALPAVTTTLSEIGLEEFNNVFLPLKTYMLRYTVGFMTWLQGICLYMYCKFPRAKGHVSRIQSSTRPRVPVVHRR